MRCNKIPRNMLIHTVKLATVSTESGVFGSRTVTEGATIEHVRIIAPKRQITVSKDNEQFSVSAILLHQPGISTACNFEVGGHILWDGQLYEIVAVENQDEADALHHTEVQLCL